MYEKGLGNLSEKVALAATICTTVFPEKDKKFSIFENV
jgi:hypothetical protein